MTQVDTLSRLEWLLTESYNVHRMDTVLVVPFEHLNVFAWTVELDGHDVAVLDVTVGDALAPSPALYRWVATKGQLVVGSLFADVTDDGTVDVTLRQTAYLDSLSVAATSEIVQWLVSTGERLRSDARDLFA